MADNMKIVAIYSSKGGVGKTATAVNLSYTAALQGHSTLLCDMDSQGAASYYFRIRPKKKFNSKKLLKGDVENFIRGTDFQNLDLLPAHFSFRNLDLSLDQIEGENNGEVLKRVFDPLAAEYDVLLLDCPPNLTLLAENIIKMCDTLVTPVIPTTLSIRALEQLLKLFKKMGVSKKKVQAFFSMVEMRKTMHVSTINTYHKNPIFMKTRIPLQAEIEKMGLYRRPVGAGTRRSQAALKYQRLWREVENGRE